MSDTQKPTMEDEIYEELNEQYGTLKATFRGAVQNPALAAAQKAITRLSGAIQESQQYHYQSIPEDVAHAVAFRLVQDSIKDLAEKTPEEFEQLMQERAGPGYGR